MEISAGQWLELIKTLTDYIAADSSVPDLKVTTLETLGWICEDIVNFDGDALIPHTDAILTAVVASMATNEPVPVVRAAAHALFNTLEFASKSFDVEVERNQLMEVMIGATQAADSAVRLEAFSCLVAVAELYYDKLPTYVEAIYERTLAALQNDNEDEPVRLQAVEFWATMADTEAEIALEADDAAEHNLPAPRQCFNVVRTVTPHLAPPLLRVLPVDVSTDMHDLAEGDEWTLAMAAATCLKSIAVCIADDVVDHVMPFINENIASSDWRMREAAVMAFGSILEGADEKVVQVLEAAMQVLLRLLVADESLMVRDTAAWSIGVACAAHAPSVATPTLLPAVVQALLQVLAKRDAPPSVAASACWAIDSIAESIRREETAKEISLAPYFNELVTALLDATQRTTGNEHSNLRVSAFEALNTMIKTAPPETVESVAALVPFFVSRLSELLRQVQSAAADHRQPLLEEEVCVCVCVCVCSEFVFLSLTWRTHRVSR
jgi:importin subunit beta-1